MAERVDPRVMQSIRSSMLRGRTADQFSMDHNEDWPPYKMYPEMWDAMQPGDTAGYMQEEPDPVRSYSRERHAQAGPFTGQRTEPEMPSARDVILMERSTDPKVREMFANEFGQEALDRGNRNRYGVRNPEYVPSPRPRPRQAPLGPGQDEYSGDQSGMLPESYANEEPNPSEAYSYIPGLRERVSEHLRGPGVARELKGGREDGSRFDRDFEDVGGDQRANIQDYRIKAIENMMQRGGQTQQGELPPEMPVEMPPTMQGQGLDEMLKQHFEDMRRKQIEEDPELGEFQRRSR